MNISLENWIRNKLQENEEMHSYEVATESIRCLIDDYNNQKTIKTKAKVLRFFYTDGSGHKVVRIYLEHDCIQAQKDLNLLHDHASDAKTWVLDDVEIYNTKL